MTRLVGDIGGTRARFARFETDRGEWLAPPTEFAMADFADPDALFEAVAAELPDCEAALFGIAGSSDPDRMVTTGRGMVFERERLEARFGAPVRLLNDFEALAWGVPDFVNLTQFGGQSARRGHALVLGPGTGLGVATLMQTGDGRFVAEGGGGHVGLSPGSHLEVELWSVLAEQHGHVSWETVLSGPGLSNLHRAMCAVWGSAGEPLAPEEITRAGLDMSDMVCHQTLESFCGLLGAAAGDYALTVGAVGGVFLVGGILPQIETFLQTSPLRRRFEEKGPMSDFVAPIPLYLVRDTHPGLIGARAALSAFG